MKRVGRRGILLIFGMLVAQWSWAQDGTYVEVRDLESWSSLGVRYKTDSKWELQLNQHLRMKSNATTVDSYFTQIEADYEGWKRFNVGFGFRYIRENDNQGNVQGYENHLRYHFNLGFKHDIQRFKLSYRLRFQSKNELGYSEEDGDFANRHLRLKVGGKYNIKNWKLDPRLSVELFRHYEVGETNGFDKFRWTVGTAYKFEQIGSIRLYFRMERELNVSYPKTTNILGVSYTYTFKSKGK